MKRIFLSLAITLLVTVSACSSDPPVGAGASGTVADGGDTDAAAVTEEDAGGGSGGQCTQAAAQLLVPVAKTSTGEVKVVSETGGTTTIYVDASAGGIDLARKNPRTYITLAGTRVSVSDTDAPKSTDWDLALKRTVLFTNSGDAGPGSGGGILINKAFDAVTKADADAAKVKAESFFDADCNAKKDQIGDAETSFTGWYEYDQATNGVSANTKISFIVKSAAGVRYKVGIVSYSGNPDGTTTAPSGGFYLLKVAQL